MPEEIKQRVLSLHEDSVLLKEQVKTLQDKLTKARAVSFPPMHAIVSTEHVCLTSLSNLKIDFLKNNMQSQAFSG